MTNSETDSTLPGSGRIARYTLWNVVGLCAPILVALGAIPVMIRGLGEDRFGLLSMVWLLVGYFTILDMGIGLALTRRAAEKLGRGRADELPALFWTACGLMLLLGVLAGVAVAAAAPWLVAKALKIPAALQPDTLRSFRAVAVCLPVVVMTAGMIGMLEARQRFGLINAVRVPLGSFTFIGPLLVLPFSRSLFAVVLVLLAGRVVEWMVYFALCLYELPALRRGFRWARQEVRPLLSTGGWITISTLLMPLLVHVDRFLIGGLLTVGAVAYYATPSEIVVKILIFPRAWVSVLFPTFAAHFAHRQQQTADLLARSLSWLLGLLFPVILLLLAGAPDGLRLWLGAEFAVRSTPVMRWLGTGIFLYSLTWIPFSFLQGIGRPDIPARIHLLEFPLYVGLSVMLIRRLGITGAAAAWALRAAIELAVMLFCARRYAPVLRACAGRWLLMGGLAAALGLGAALCGPLRLRAAVTATGLAVWAAAAWRGLLPAEDRAALQRWWANRQNRS